MKTPDDYMREMMELYSRSNSKPEPVPAPQPIKMPEPEPKPEPKPIPTPEPVPEPEPQPKPPVPEPVPEPEPIVPMPEPIPTPEAESDDLPKPLPLPEVPKEIMDYPESVKPSQYTPGENETSFGWIQVTTRTAGNAIPLEGVSVLILKQNEMDIELLMSLITDSSGNTPKVKLPAPPISNDRNQAFSTYEIRAFLPGYTRMESVSVPVFSGITSIQAFELVPLPVGASDDQPAIINQNTQSTF